MEEGAVMGRSFLVPGLELLEKESPLETGSGGAR